MSVHVFNHRRGRVVTLTKARLAPQPLGGKRGSLAGRDPFYIPYGSILIDCIAVRISAYYDVPASAFNWHSKDGLVEAINEEPFSGGALQPSGNGVGTVMTRVLNSDPFPSNAFLNDEEA